MKAEYGANTLHINKNGQIFRHQNERLIDVGSHLKLLINAEHQKLRCEDAS